MRVTNIRCLVLLCVSAAAFGQTFGEIAGDVRDPSGSVVAGAEVKVTLKGTGAQRSAVTNDVGLYSFPALQPGVYDVSVTKTGFQSMTRSDLELQVQQTARVDFALQLGQENQIVEVSAGAPLLTTENATVGSVIENKRIVELPLNGRNFLQLISLAPNVTSGFSDSRIASTRLGASRSAQNISVAGQRSEWNHFMLDGVENTDPTYNTYVFLPSIDALQEFKVQNGIYPAEFGRAIGQINASTKSGTNEFHGAMFEFLRNDKLDATDYAFTANRPPKNPFKWNQYGYTLGGPVWIPKLFNGRNRLFFLTNYEGYRDRKALQDVYSVPFAAMRGGNFAGLPVIYDPASRTQSGSSITATPFPNNQIPANRLDPNALKLLEFLPLPNANTGGFAQDLQQGDRRVINKDQFNLRIDFVESASSNWFGRYSWGSEVQSQATIKETGTNIDSEPRQEMISNSRVFSPTMVNEFRFSHIGFANSLTTPLGNKRDVDAELGLPSPVSAAWGIPNISVNTFSAFGDTSNGPYVDNNHIFTWSDNFSWVKGKHSLRFGAEIRRDRFNTIGNTDPRGTLTFSGTATENPAGSFGYSSGSGTGFADFLLGYVRQSSGAVGLGFGQFRATSQSYYVDDTWRIHPKVTVSLGLRYENTPPFYDKSQNFANIELPPGGPNPNVINPSDPALHPTIVRLGNGDFYQGLSIRFNPAINVARDGRLGQSGVKADNNDFAPRIGIAWSPTDKWTVRAGAGVFYVQDISALYLDVARNLAGPRQGLSNNNFPSLTLENPYGNLGSLVTVSTPSVLGIQVNRRTPYLEQYSFNLQRQFGADTSFELGYLGSEGHKLQSWVGINEPLASPIGSPQSRFPYPEFTPSWIQEGNGNSSYNAFSAKLQHRLGQGVTLMESYTWSKSIDLSSGTREHFGEQQFPQNAYCLQCERGLSIFNVAHRSVTSVLYELPFGRGKAFLNNNTFTNLLLGGWQLSSIITLQTGLPATVISGYDSSNRAGGVDRPDTTGAEVALPRGQQDPTHFFNTAAFVRPVFGTLGDVGRNTITGPGIIDWDFSTLKNFPVREKQQLQFRFEAFNLPNHPNWGLPNTTLTSPGFGTVTTTRIDMRELQFGLKFIF